MITPNGQPSNLFEWEDELKNWSNEELTQELENPTRQAPGYMVFDRLSTNIKAQEDAAAKQAMSGANRPSMVEEVVAKAKGG